MSTNRNLSGATAVTLTTSSHFQRNFNDALKAYKKLTKTDLLTHPLAAPLETCDSPSAIRLVLEEQILPNRSSLRDDINEMLTMWLGPTVNALYTLSNTLGQSVSLVWFRTWDHLRPTHSS
jgi:hypothetical protein